MRLGGDKELIEEVRRSGGSTGPQTFWTGAWMLKPEVGYNGLGRFLSECSGAGHEALIHFWFWGDDISPAVLTDGTKDKLQGVWKDWSIAREMAGRIGQVVQASGVPAYITVEPEFNKNGTEAHPKMRDYLWDVRNTLRKACPGARLVFAPGTWGDPRVLATFFCDVAKSMDYVGVQSLKFPPRHGDYRGEADRLRATLTAFRDVLGLPACIYDVGFSSYDSGQDHHPFAGGSGTAFEPQQAEAVANLSALDGLVEFLVYRALRDDPGFNVANYGGYAERHLGVVRADGTRKPAYDALMSLARAPVAAAEPPAPGQAATAPQPAAMPAAAPAATKEAPTPGAAPPDPTPQDPDADVRTLEQRLAALERDFHVLREHLHTA